ncbi:AAA domain protein [uncultured archaeon]|nr:AAA domain protein [uncultured archaeon]
MTKIVNYMLDQSIRSWNPWWAQKMLPSLTGIRRDITGEIIKSFGTPHIKDIIGVRRCGKTTVLYQAAEHLMSQDVSSRDIMFLNFDDPTINASSFEELQKEIFKINPDTSHLFLDEIQQKTGWERWVRTLYDTKKFQRIFISGSSASLLSRDIGRVLTGRHITFNITPFSFREYLKKRGWEDFSPEFTAYNKDKLLHYLTAYLEAGGFPETVGLDDFGRKQVLTSLYNDIIARDISSRYGASFEITDKICRFMLTNHGGSYSSNSVARATGTAVETAEKYIGYLKESLLISDLPVFSFKLKTQFKQNKKTYPADTGLRNAVCMRFSRDIGKLAETAVFHEIKRQNPEVFYWKNQDGYEVDFVVKEGQRIAGLFQVAWNVIEEKTQEREERAIACAMDELGVTSGIILTEDYEKTFVKNGKTIKYIPLWKWLLI